LVALIVVVLITIVVFIVEALSHFVWLLTCNFKYICKKWRSEKKYALMRQRTALHVRNDVIGSHKAPTLKSRKEMAKKVGGAFLQILGHGPNSAKNKPYRPPPPMNFHPSHPMMQPVLGHHGNRNYPQLNPPRQVIQPVII
jgi:hypothetical protein